MYYLWHKLHAFVGNFNPSQLFKNQKGAFLNKRIIENRLEVAVAAWFVEIAVAVAAGLWKLAAENL